jgi:hypothetical protein
MAERVPLEFADKTLSLRHELDKVMPDLSALANSRGAPYTVELHVALIARCLGEPSSSSLTDGSFLVAPLPLLEENTLQ